MSRRALREEAGKLPRQVGPERDREGTQRQSPGSRAGSPGRRRHFHAELSKLRRTLDPFTTPRGKKNGRVLSSCRSGLQQSSFNAALSQSFRDGE